MMRKKIVYSIIVVILLYPGAQVYWLIKENGSVIIYSGNSSNLNNIKIDIFLDEELLLSESYSNEHAFDIKRLSLFKSFGRHEIKVVVESKGIYSEEKFIVLGVKWINVEFVNKDNRLDDYEIFLTVESAPTAFE